MSVEKSNEFDLGNAIVNRFREPGGSFLGHANGLFTIDEKEISIFSKSATDTFGNEIFHRHISFFDIRQFPVYVAWEISNKNPQKEKESDIAYISRLKKETTPEDMQEAVKTQAEREKQNIIRKLTDKDSGYYNLESAAKLSLFSASAPSSSDTTSLRPKVR